MNLKIGGNDVGKLMYNGQEFGGATKLEPGTILYIANYGAESFKDAHLLSTTKNWSNIDGINVVVTGVSINNVLYEFNISGDDFKNLDIEKTYTYLRQNVTVSRSIVDGEYRLNISGLSAGNYLIVKAI